MIPFISLSACWLIWNVFSFIMVAHDKRIASNARSDRIPEKEFASSAMFFGGAGILAGFYALRHKTRHKALLRQVWLYTIGSHLILAAIIGVLWNILMK